MNDGSDLQTVAEVRDGQLEADSDFRAYWERTAVARAVALAIIGYRVDHHLTQTQLAREIGLRQPQVARLEAAEHTPSLDMLRRLSSTLGLRFIVEVTPASERTAESGSTFPADIEFVEDVTANGSRTRVAAG